MQRLIKWLEQHFFGELPERRVQPNVRVTNTHLRAAQVRRRSAALAAARQAAERESLAGIEAAPHDDDYGFDCEVVAGLHIENYGPGKNVLATPLDALEDSGTYRALRIVEADEAEEDIPMDAGFDPYNTGSFDRSANWSRARNK